jgi:hypothetical protein
MVTLNRAIAPAMVHGPPQARQCSTDSTQPWADHRLDALRAPLQSKSARRRHRHGDRLGDQPMVETVGAGSGSYPLSVAGMRDRSPVSFGRPPGGAVRATGRRLPCPSDASLCLPQDR